LNVPPNPEGVLHDIDARRLLACRDRLAAMFGSDLAAGLPRTWRRTGERTAVAELDLGRGATVAVACLEEDVTKGQMVGSYTLSGSDGASWRVLSKGRTIGHARLDRFEPTTLRRVRLSVDESVARPEPIRIKLF
jgi:alpha-L-fucosidase